MSFLVYAFNDGYSLYLFLNGLKSYFLSPEWAGMIFMVVSALLLVGILAVNQISILGYARAYVGPILLYLVFFSQTAQIRIEDDWAREAYTVDKMPVAIAIPLSLCTTAERAMLELVEKYIMPPDTTSLKDFDFFMEAAALGETLNGKTISHYEVQASVARYFDDCVLKGISTGFVNESVYYRSGTLLEDSFMPWGVYFTEIVDANGRKEVMTCRDAYQRIWTTVTGEAASAAPSGMAGYLSSLFGGRHKNTADTIMAMDALASNLFPGHQSTSEALFQQTFMINALQSSLAKSNPQALAALSQAEVAQSTGIAAASAVYIKKLPKLRAMMKLVIVGMLPVVAAFFLASSGRPLLQWTAALLSVSLWLPLMAVIKATYIASAINELQGMILPTGGVTLPNKLRLMAWITDTSTVAGTLAFTIPTFAALALQMILPRLALSVGGIVMASKGAEGFAQRSGMQALQGAERTAKELELDKVNQTFMEAGDTHLARNQRMNELVSSHGNVAFGRDTGTSPFQYNGTHTSAIQGQGYTIQGGMDARTSQALQESVSLQQAHVQTAQASAAHNFAMGNGTSRSQNDFEQFVNSLDKSQQKQFSEAHQAIQGITERVAKSYGYEGEEVAQVQRALTAQVHAGAGFRSDQFVPGWIAEKLTGAHVSMEAQAGGNAGVSTGENERAKRAAQEIMDSVYSDQQVSNYMQSRAQTISEAERMGHGQEWAQSASRQEGFQSSMQRVESASQSLSTAQTHMAEQQASVSATAGRSINTGDLLSVTSRGDLELLSMNPGMNRLHGALQRGVHNIDELRIAANADLSSQLRKAEAGDSTALQTAVRSLDVISQSNQYNAHDAEIAKQILEQRAGIYTVATEGGHLPSHGETANEARLYREAYSSGVDAGARRLEDSTDTRREPQVSKGEKRGNFYRSDKEQNGNPLVSSPKEYNAVRGIVESNRGHSGSNRSAGIRYTEDSLTARQESQPQVTNKEKYGSFSVEAKGTSGVSVAATPEKRDSGTRNVSSRSGSEAHHAQQYNTVVKDKVLSSLSPEEKPSDRPQHLRQEQEPVSLHAEPAPASGNSQWENLPKPFLKPTEHAGRLHLEEQAEASRKELYEQAETSQKELMQRGMTAAKGVSHIDATRGTVVNTAKILNGETAELFGGASGDKLEELHIKMNNR